jgi:ABC-type multidrug transport system ATPase subunit
MSDTVVVMNHGRLVYQGPLDSLVSDLGGGGWELQVQPRDRQRAEEVLIRQGLAVTTLNESAVRIACDPDLTASALTNLLAVAGLDVTDITRAKSTLERAFLTLTAAENR